MGILYVVATPIGNMEDISKRALRILSEVDLILCEDTRNTKKILNEYQIKTPTLSYHQHSKLAKIEEIINYLKEGRNLALVTDAGTPGISDPGGQLVDKVYEAGLKVISVPGPSALAAAASISGFAMDKFLFLGFPPAKKKRKKFFGEVVESKYPVIFYESPHRIIKTLNELDEAYQSFNLTAHVVVCRELTKKFETIYRGKITEVISKISQGEDRGEFVIIAEVKR